MRGFVMAMNQLCKIQPPVKNAKNQGKIPFS
jgi:hypothetical protein